MYLFIIAAYTIQTLKDYTVMVANTKLTTIFSRIPFISSRKTEVNTENKKISYWLKKLHIQKEQVRIDNNRREEQSNDASKQFLDEQSVIKNDQDITQSGINESAKNIATKDESDKQLVNDLVKKSNRCIISISSLFPWDFFPNTIEVEESRVNFKFRQFLSSQSHSVDIKDISNVFIECSLFFATLQVVSRTYIQNDIKIGNLSKKKAKKVLRIIEGLRTFVENNINTSNYEIDELISKIEEFHTSNNISS